MGRLEQGVRRRVRRLLFPLRRATAPARALPDFLVIGAQKAGTTALHRYLSGHPAVVVSWRKEVHYFDLHHHLGSGWYRAHFPTRLEVRVRGARAVGEGTPYYLFHPLVPARVARLLPGVRLLAVLRDPVDRAWSHFQHETRLGREDRTFERAVSEELEQLPAAEARVRAGAPDRVHHRHAYLARGRYAEQLERWLEHHPRSRLLVLDFGELVGDPGRAWERVLEHLALPGWVPPAFPRVYAGGYSERPDPGLRRELRSHFAPHQERLRDLLGWAPGEPR